MKLRTEFDFDSAHRLVGYKGKCKNVHGHIWRVEIEVEGKGLDDVGMLWDFTNVKKLKNMFDHKTILKDCEENKAIIKAILDTCTDGNIMSTEDVLYLMENNPTAENLCKEILKLCKKSDERFKYKIKVWESPKSYAEVEG